MSHPNAGVFIGTSGWSYDHWQGVFYPEHLAVEDRLAFYAERLSSVEINNCFYQLPEKETLRRWHDCVPRGFVFTAKASRYITHMKKLKDPAQSLDAFLDRIGVLEDQLGPILFQLPPHWHFNRERLAGFLEALSGDFRYAFELRDHSWLNEETYALLEQHAAALCLYELDGFASPKELTADFVYIRLHGPDDPYQGSYDTRALAGWAGALSAWLAQGRAVHCYFNNDEAGCAAQNALSLQDMLHASPSR